MKTVFTSQTNHFYVSKRAVALLPRALLALRFVGTTATRKRGLQTPLSYSLCTLLSAAEIALQC